MARRRRRNQHLPDIDQVQQAHATADQQRNEEILRRLEEVYRPSVGRLMLVGMLASPLQRLFGAVETGISKRLGELIANTEFMRHLLGAENAQQVQLKLQQFANAQYSGGRVKGVTLTDIQQAIVGKYAPKGIAPYAQAAVRLQQETRIFSPSMVAQVGIQNQIAGKPQIGMTFGEYLIQQSTQSQLMHGSTYVKAAWFEQNHELLVKYEQLKRYGQLGVLGQLQVTGEGYRLMFSGIGRLFTQPFSEDVKAGYKEQLVRIQQGQIYASPVQWYRAFKYFTFEQLPTAQRSQYQIGLQSIVQLIKNFEDTVQQNVLHQLEQSTEQQHVLAQLRTRAKRAQELTGRSEHIELKRLQVEYYFRTGAHKNDPRVQQLIEELKNRLPRAGELNPQFKRAGLSFVTFEDIQIGSQQIKPRDIFGEIQPLFGESDYSIHESTIATVQRGLIEAGLPADTQIGYGLYKFKTADGYKVTQLIPGWQSILETAVKYSQQTVIPFLGFNPLQSLQPSLLLEYFFKRPAIQQYVSADQYVPTKAGMKQIRDIQYQIAVRNVAAIRHEDGSYKPGQLYGLLDQYIAHKRQLVEFITRELKQRAGINIDISAIDKLIKQQSLDELAAAKELALTSITEQIEQLNIADDLKNELLSRYKYSLQNIITAQYARLTPPEHVRVKRVDEILKQTLVTQKVYGQRDIDAINRVLQALGTDVIDDNTVQFQLQGLASVSNQAKFVIKTVHQQQRDQKLVYYGTRPFITVGAFTYDVSDYVQEAINLNKAELSGRMFEVYQLETGMIEHKAVPRDQVRAIHKLNLPFVRDFDIGESIYSEFKRVVVTPFKYDEQISTLADILKRENMYQQQLGLRRQVRRVDLTGLANQRIEGLADFGAEQLYGVDEETIQTVQTQFYNVQKLVNFQQVQYKTGNLNETERKQFEQITRVLQLNSLEQSVYSQLDRYIQRTQRLPDVAWFMNQVSKTGATQFDVMLGFVTTMSQVATKLREITDSTIFSKQTFKAIELVEQTSGQHVAATLYENIRTIQHVFSYLLSLDTSINKRLVMIPMLPRAEQLEKVHALIETVLEHNEHLRLTDEEAEIMQRQFITTGLYSQRAFTLRERYQLNTSVVINDLLKVFDQFRPEVVAGVGPYYQAENTITAFMKDYAKKSRYSELLYSTFGRSFVENLSMALRGETVPFFEAERYGVNLLDSQLVTHQTAEDVFFADKVKITIAQNKFVQLRPMSTQSSAKDLWRMLFPDVSKRPEDVTNITIGSLMLHNILGKPSSYLETLGLGRNNLYEQTNQLKDFGGQMHKIQWLQQGLTMLGMLDFAISAASLGHTSGQQIGGELQTNLYVGSMQILNALGVQQLGEYMHTTMPGFLATQFGLYGLQTGGLPGYFFGASVGTLMEFIPTVREQVLAVEGVTNVPVYQAQGWEFGQQPYWGYNVKQYRPSLLYMIRKDYQYTPLMYGSRFEYQIFEQPFPTPLNAFGLIPLLTDYYDRKLLGFRPYQRTGSPSGTGTPQLLTPPVFLEPTYYALATVQQMTVRTLVPSRDLLTQYTMQYQLQLNQLSQSAAQTHAAVVSNFNDQQAFVDFVTQQIQQYQDFATSVRWYMNEYTARAYNQMRAATNALVSGYYNSIQQSRYTIEHILEYFTTYSGFIGFMGQQFISPLSLGTEEQTKRIRLASSDYWRTPERLYYQAELGNILTTTEYIRRLVPNIRRQEMQVNPLPNIYLSLNYPWLPEHYRTGDQYQKISYGEFRLPGPGYEYIRGSVDDYGLIDIYRILQNITPRSGATKTLERYIVEYQKALEVPEYRYIIQQQREEQEAVRKGMQTREAVFNMKLEEKQYAVEKYLGEGRFLTRQGAVIEIRGVELDIDALQKRVYETENVTIREQYERANAIKQQLEQQLASYEGGTITVLEPVDVGLKVRWYGGEDFRIQAILPGLEIPEPARKLETEVDIRQHYKPNVFNRLWEHVSHSFGYHFEKFVPIRSAYEEFSRFYYYGMYRVEWNRPFSEVFAKQFLTNIQQNPFQQMSHQFFVGFISGANPTIGLQLGGMNQFITGVQSLVVPAQTPMPHWTEVRSQEQQQRQLQYLQGDRGIAELEKLPSVEQLTREIPIYEQTVFQKLLEQQAADYEKILQIQPPYMRLPLETVYRQKLQYQAGLAPDTSITDEQRQRYYSEYIEPGMSMLPDIVIEEQQNIDVDQYRTLLFIHNTRNISMTSTFDTQIIRAKTQITKQQQSLYTNSVYSQSKYLRQMVEQDIYVNAMRRDATKDPYQQYLYGI